MPVFTVFISSVQKEFAAEREALNHHFKNDALLSQFFRPVLFEYLPAESQAPDKVYINEVERSQIYIGLLGADYGYEDAAGISPTEHEYDHASQLYLERWIFIKGDNSLDRHPKEKDFIAKVQQEVSRKRFNSTEQLLQEVSKCCVSFLQRQGLISHKPFDEAVTEGASIADIDEDKVQLFIRAAKANRGFPLPEGSSTDKVLSHLDMLKNARLPDGQGVPTNSALLTFGKKPQQFFPAAIVKCAHFHGREVAKPIPDHKQFDGDVFEQIDQAVDFVLSKINVSVGTREESTQAPLNYELPRAAVREAIVNAVAHRNYNSNAAVQVMLFSDRLEVTNPGKLPPELTPEKLKTQHASYPANPKLARCLYLTGYIEQMGTGTLDIMRLAQQAHLHEPDFAIEEDFKIIIWRPDSGDRPGTDQVTDQVEPDRASTGQVPGKYRASREAERVVMVLEGEMKRAEIQDALQLKHRDTFTENYLQPALAEELVEMTLPDKPNSPRQRYRLTAKGQKLKQKLQNK